jgi:hypothetical protein
MILFFCVCGRRHVSNIAVTLFLPLLQYNTITIKIITTVTMDTVTPTMTPIFESLLSAVAEVKIKIKCHSKGIKTLSEKNQEWVGVTVSMVTVVIILIVMVLYCKRGKNKVTAVSPERPRQKETTPPAKPKEQSSDKLTENKSINNQKPCNYPVPLMVPL